MDLDGLRKVGAMDEAVDEGNGLSTSLELTDLTLVRAGTWQDDEPQSGLPEGAEMPTDCAMEEEDGEPGTSVAGPMKRSQARCDVPGQEDPIFHCQSMTDSQSRAHMHAPMTEAPQLVQEEGTCERQSRTNIVFRWTVDAVLFDFLPGRQS
jgi:pre-mRNA-processing factor 17